MFSANSSQVSNAANYIEDVFQTWLYTGNGSTQTITNGIDLSTKGGLVWIKDRTQAYDGHLIDTARGGGYYLVPSSTGAQGNQTGAPTSFNSNGFTEQDQTVTSDNYASWTFREQPKFFDVVTYTGNGAGSKTINHNLGSVPGCIIVKRLDSTGDWLVYHRGLYSDPAQAYNFFLKLNTTSASSSTSQPWGSAPTSTSFSISSGQNANVNGATYVAYLFAHNAGGFGLTGTDNVISCGSYTGNAGSQTIDLGYEPQLLLVKRSSGGTGNWYIMDNMRGLFTLGVKANYLQPNTTAIEAADPNIYAYATGFGLNSEGSAEYNASGSTYIYIAIRRGPMKVPTSGTSVFSPALEWTPNSNVMGYLGAPADMEWIGYRNGASINVNARTRLTGGNRLSTSSTAAEIADPTNYWDNQLGFNQTAGSSGTTYAMWTGRRAPSFLDVVCYTGTGSATTFSHNLGVAPELMIVKNRSGARGWVVYNAFSGATKYLYLNTTDAATTYSTTWNNTAPTSSVFTVGTDAETNFSGGTFVAYLFATCAGVSKVGSYTGTGTTKQVDCGFTGGARFVLIKRTDSTGDWYVWDTARGIVSGNDPYLLLNSTAAEVTSTDYVDTYSAGFEISSTAPAAINASGGTFIFLAIA